MPIISNTYYDVEPTPRYTDEEVSAMFKAEPTLRRVNKLTGEKIYREPKTYTPDEAAIIKAIDEEFDEEGNAYHGLEITQILTDFYTIRIANWYGGFYETDNCARIIHTPHGNEVRLFLTQDWENNLRCASLNKWW